MNEHLLLDGLLVMSNTVGWLMYVRERHKSRDYLTDLSQLAYDHDITIHELRRAKNWSEAVEGIGHAGIHEERDADE